MNELRASVFRTALVLTHNRADAEDLVQTAFVRALDQDSLNDQTNWRAWLKTVVRHLAVDLARRNQRWRTTELLESLEPHQGAAEPAEQAWADVTPEQLQAAVDSIDANYQAVYRLHHVEGASYAQVAEQLNIPVRTVGTRLHRARGRIRQSLLKAMDNMPEAIAV
ncbi:MAG TPA: sigma-70 family RNA polymerase sigma factor [Polyangiales bacterium]|nr:sigma-70 family RNA polymerase sigma factor [Polyangiales bacterium]